ncbi:PRDX4 protein, partial [Polypterus senegalus]
MNNSDTVATWRFTRANHIGKLTDINEQLASNSGCVLYPISKPAPNWEGTAVINGEFKELKLSDYKGKYLVFFFYPLDFTFVCPTEIIAFSDRVHEFHAINAEVVACSVDSQFTHLAWINTPRKQGGLGTLKIPLLSDLTHQISKDYGVYLEDQGHTLRGLFIIDNKGVLRQITMNDLPVGRSVDETLRLVQAFQYTDKHGEGQCCVFVVKNLFGFLSVYTGYISAKLHSIIMLEAIN